MGILLAKFSEWAAELVDQSGNASGEMKRVDVLREVVDEGLLDVAHHRDDLFGEFGEAERGGSRDKAFAAADDVMVGVERVPAAGVVGIPGAARFEGVVGRVVDSAETERRPGVIALRGRSRPGTTRRARAFLYAYRCARRDWLNWKRC